MKREPNVKNNNRTVIVLTGIVIVMFGFGFAMAPLYTLFCNLAGIQTLGGNLTTEKAAVEDTSKQSRYVIVKFDSTITRGLPWKFTPSIKEIKVKTGEPNNVIFLAKNFADESIIAQAIPNLLPWDANTYFNKVECFCFQKQLLEAQESKEMLIRFVVSTSLPDKINSLTLSYTVMNADTDSMKKYSNERQIKKTKNYLTDIYFKEIPLFYSLDKETS
jgi:cytochrome c oxidase assembly protein subunit 11|tara:strand:+ start:3505 stop:4158 length:654 start_codon:yes stop_codon:yes gene_type:complete